jgi:GNAT superfamily N-acetyltransferase
MVRPFQLTDYTAVNRLLASVGWPTRSQAGWAWLATSPAAREIHAPQGWVHEDQGGDIVGFLGNLVLPFDFGGRRLRGATGFSIVVRPEARGAGRRLIDAFLDQDGVFAHYTLNANAVSAPIYARHGMTPWPETTSGLKLSWVADPVACMSSRLWRAAARLEPSRTAFPERLLAHRLDAPAPLSLPAAVEVVSLLEPDGDYARYWARLSEDGRLRVDRSPAEMAWRFADPDLQRGPLVLGFRRGSDLTSVAIALLAKGHPLEPAVLEVVDLTALSHEREGCEMLLRALIDNAPRLGAAKTRLPVVSPWLLARLGHTARIARREGGWGHCHARFAPAGPPPELWSPTAWDGDYTVCLRPAPLGARSRQAA